MEGLLDHLLREELTALGGVDGAVSEFIRITDQLMPRRVFTRIVPELLRGGQTEAGTPVRPQLLGSDPVCLAENAARLAELNPPGIDLNFGCPAKCVNRHRGGAVLLDEPDLLHVIVQKVRRAVPSRIPVSAKMRLGNEDSARMLDCARALASGGAAELVVHARTKRQGYKPPAYWAEIGTIRAAVSIPLIANGEIWTVRDALQARAESGCADLMLGRGAVADPSLPLALRAHDVGLMSRLAPWADLVPSLWSYWARVQGRVASKHQAGRLKQWLHYLRRTHTEAETVYQAVRAVQAPAAFEQALRAALPPPAVGAISPCQKMQQGEALSVATST
ncbi:tRNA dihydrouridine synthase [Inhella gelatinilytica]|uniref:tRNA-dihydrouridine(16) synthase n=1 Tax=Inhella gelatinilytica TaxID=2795030 RepID=A0A931NC26_9BURK|nr:tRNA-dihydrouridine synthase [Inhella gelatinilytica]MBH9554223.1 tRNA-dihydrouridine synthase [Inhella gelatinilytica]